ncbi:c-type cytochrome [Oscillatoria sp. CS-180]|uniref:c-type cytochrome n=1 Tax=Oscillatoria sp. CS-180 TaxID=3021720 RepID=UPI00232D9A2B|nr:c-type cytochrome [Oscillatoria sp. CS-180]
MKRSRVYWIACLMALLVWWTVTVPSALAESSSVHAQELFSQQCAGCHINGGNIVRRGKNLKLRALQRNHVDSIEAIAQLITNGKGAMSAYGDRLSAEDIDLLAHFVWDKAQVNWK